MSSFWGSLFGRDERPTQQQSPPAPPPQVAAPSEPAQAETPAELLDKLTELVSEVNVAGARMPEGGVPAVRDVEDELRPLLVYLGKHPATEAEMVGVRAMVNDYLPTTVHTFLALPAAFAESHRNRLGRTPAEELVEQLYLLADGAREYATAIYAGDAQKLSNQGRFLQNKFSRSELDL